jgi:hypothetical protein
MKNTFDYRMRSVLIVLASCFAVVETHAALTILSTEYKPDQVFPEWNCYWSGSCETPIVGVTVRAFVKNTGASTVTITDVNLAGYSLKTVISRHPDPNINPAGLNSIYFYWDDPPRAILDAGEPVYYKIEPSSLAAGRTAQVTVRLRHVPVTLPVNLQIVTSAGNVTTNIAASDASTPRLASIGYSEDLRKIYLHWRRSGGAAPASVWLDGTNVTSLTTTVGDPAMNFAASVITLPNPLPFFSYHVYEGVYADAAVAGAGQRAWTNKFIYSTYCKFEDLDCNAWLQEATSHGFNNIQMNLCGMCLDASITSTGYGYTIMGKDKLNPADPDMWFLDDEPDLAEDNQVNGHCGTGILIPCEGDHRIGTLVMKRLDDAVDLRTSRPNVPTTVNLDGGLEPESFFTWGPAVDILQTDNYYEPRLNGGSPLFSKAIFSHAVARTACAGAEPNPSNHLLYSTKLATYPVPASKRFEAYYSLAGGSKGMGYWWLKSPNGLQNGPEGAALWKEMGLIGNEIRTARNLIVKSTPVDLPLAPSPKVWAQAVASGIDTLILYVVNDNYTNDATGCHYTLVSNATVTATLPLWMQASPTAFEVTAGGLRDVSTQFNGNQLQVFLGALALTRMIVITTDATLRTAVQARYDSVVKSYVCSFAPELCVNSPPTISQQPVNRRVLLGGTTNFTAVATGSGTLSYQWQTNTVNLSNGAHYSGVTTGNLTVTGAGNNDMVNYRCVITNAYGSVTSSVVTLTITNVPATPTANPATSITSNAFSANWSTASRATGYRLDVSTNNAFGNFLSGYDNLDVGNVTSRSVTGLSGSTTYYYRLRAYNEVGNSGNSGPISVTTAAALIPPIANAATGVTSDGFTANWNSVNGATGYRLDVSTTNTFSNFVSGYNNLDVANVLSRNVTGLTTGATYYYRVRAYNSGGVGGNSATITVSVVPANPCLTISNADFEGGFSIAGGGFVANGWLEWEAVPGAAFGYDETGIVHGGAHSQRIRVGGTNATSGGVYQRVPVNAGGTYTIGVWTYSADTSSACSLGVDPGGGTNFNSGVAWSLATTNVAWVRHTWTGSATASYLTIFHKVAAPDTVKRNGYFDDGTPSASGGSLQLTVQRNGNELTLLWPECPAARLERADSLSPPAVWTTATNPVNVANGAKTVTLNPVNLAGYFRLVVE